MPKKRIFPATKSPSWKRSSKLRQPATCANNNSNNKPQPFKKHTSKWDLAPITLSPATFILHLKLQHHLPCLWTLLLLLHICSLQIFPSPPPFLNDKAGLHPYSFSPWLLLAMENSKLSFSHGPPQLPMTLTPPGTACNFPPSHPVQKGKIRDSSILTRTDT